MLIVRLALCQETKCERAAILNAESISRVWATQAERNNRNAAAHGGNVLADIQVIDEMEQDDPAKARLWKKAFFRLYHLHYAEVHLPLLYPPPEVIKTCNLLATILLVKPWRVESKKTKDNIIHRSHSTLGPPSTKAE
jgi:hypothetical protein